MSPRAAASITIALALASVLSSAGCTKTPSSETASTDTTTTVGLDTATPIERAREAGRIAAEIDKDPDRAPAILEAHGTTPEAYEDLLYEIAVDPALTEAYEQARGTRQG